MSEPVILRTKEDLRRWRRREETLALVPTMGALHGGHVELIRLAAQHADRVLVSIFVNPTQFGPGEDYDSYPRTLRADLQTLAREPVDAVFVPSVEEMYPSFPERGRVQIRVGPAAKILEGAQRPGHFDGVCQVVAKLFNMTDPQVAVFGQKDAQQLAVIRQMVEDLNYPIHILAAPTVRETDGLALSSRNAYLSTEERLAATSLRRALNAGLLAGAASGGVDPIAAVNAALQEMIAEPLVHPEYAAVVRDGTFELVAQATVGSVEMVGNPVGELTLLVAARVGDTRLIDNMQWRVKPDV